MALTQEQRNTLSILGYLYYRMGRLDNAATVFAALDKLAPEGNAEKALQLLHRVMDGQTLSTRHAALHLLRARALWQQGRKDEARAAVNEYLYLAGNGPSAQALAEPPFNSMGKRV